MEARRLITLREPRAATAPDSDVGDRTIPHDDHRVSAIREERGDAETLNDRALLAEQRVVFFVRNVFPRAPTPAWTLREDAGAAPRNVISVTPWTPPGSAPRAAGAPRWYRIETVAARAGGAPGGG